MLQLFYWLVIDHQLIDISVKVSVFVTNTADDASVVRGNGCS